MKSPFKPGVSKKKFVILAVSALAVPVLILLIEGPREEVGYIGGAVSLFFGVWAWRESMLIQK